MIRAGSVTVVTQKWVTPAPFFMPVQFLDGHHGGGKRRGLMQALVHDQPEPSCDGVKNNGGKDRCPDHHGPK